MCGILPEKLQRKQFLTQMASKFAWICECFQASFKKGCSLKLAKK